MDRAYTNVVENTALILFEILGKSVVVPPPPPSWDMDLGACGLQ